MHLSRRHFLKSAAAVTLGFQGLQRHVAFATQNEGRSAGFGPLVEDPDGILSLPADFTYRILSRTGVEMADGLLMPGAHDAMAAFQGSGGRTLLVCNHELTSGALAAGAFGPENDRLSKVPANNFYDFGGGVSPSLGGTTTTVLGKDGQVERRFLSLAGTVRNCAGGPTPWGSWVTCEETTQRGGEAGYEKDHGYNFEVPATQDIRRADPIPLKAMGRFNHEAVAVDPSTKIVYQTEDTGDSLIYRYLANAPGHLQGGGRLQALAVHDHPSLDTRNWESTTIRPGQRLEVYWIDIENVESPDNDLRLQGFTKGAARFARGEGMWYGKDAVYFACTSGGHALKGQVWRYYPSAHEAQPGEATSPGTLELFVEPNEGAVVENCDNLTVSPWGDIVLCEDGPEQQFLVGVTQEGQLYKLARNAFNSSEFAGAVFSPDGMELYVNIQNPGITLAIRGPWDRAPVSN
ncbi:MAG TPA: DUF839 domain-containing protein [Candidatus Latescibacteria bacterium]|jgi:hypothetical protein|nr:DUF839 domain-containing protein [Candidatus Latescibacterota bacterium]MDP7635081.1 DUF839 domain-containing protein [Candidatus Latescibacterota bacterium]MED5416160.1 alkaline phosphatase PhoX [Candidatus Latescibacterota bacterium]HJN27038.1 DUF839 domain-containing protein [Candidatus Latescibacterota bacterium]